MPAGLLITLAAAIGYSAWGFALRVRIAGRPPVTNMYETVIWASFIVSVLGIWFCVLPLHLAGIELGLATGRVAVPAAARTTSGVIRQAWNWIGPKPEEQATISQPASGFPCNASTSLVRLAVFASVVWFFTRSGTSFRIIKLVPPIFGKADRLVVAGNVARRHGRDRGFGVVRLAGGGRLGLLPLLAHSEARRGTAASLWEQTFQRRYFLLAALPVVACFGMMLAHFVGMSSPDIMNPRIGSITAVLRNNYWLTIHVLTIVSSYGAGGLAWGLGNLAMLFYLFGKYRVAGTNVVGGSRGHRCRARLPQPTAARASIWTPLYGGGNRRWPRG